MSLHGTTLSSMPLLAEANSLANADERRVVMGKIQALIIEEGVTCQPYWRYVQRHHVEGLGGLRHAYRLFASNL